jgi:triacylglycerol esterase/lipase EstA (alpha/beta hydrolase family)
VLVHGTLENMTFNWFSLAPLLKNAGYCVFALNYGEEPSRHLAVVPGSAYPGGTAPIEKSARELGAFVARVLAATGAATVDIVGHSQGGMMPRYYLRFDGGAGKVTHLIGLSPSNHGRRLGRLSRLTEAPRVLGSLLGPAQREQAAGSDFLRKLNAGGDTIPGVRYTVIETRYDEVIVPYTSAFLRGPDVTNILLQRACRLDLSDHATTPFDSIALRYVLNALDPAHAVPPTCRLVLAGQGG